MVRGKFPGITKAVFYCYDDASIPPFFIRSYPIAIVLFLAWALFLLGCSTGAQERLYPFEKDGKWGYMTESHKVVIEPKYIMAEDFSPEGIAAVADKNSWAYINARGDVLVHPFIYDNGPDYFSEGLARYEAEGKIGFFDKRGKIIIPAQFDFAFPFHEGLAVFCSGCRAVSEGEHKIVVGGKWGFIDKRGKTVIPAQFDYISPFHEGLAEFCDGCELVGTGEHKKVSKGKWGFIDRSGNVVIKPQFDATQSFSKGVARVYRKGKWGYINKKGVFVVEPQIHSK